MKRLGDGSLNDAVHVMPAQGLDIARETKSIANGLAWTALAGDKLPAVIEHEIYRRATPADFSRGSLERVLAIDDRTAISRLASVPRQARDALLGLEPNELKSLAKSLSETELATLGKLSERSSARPARAGAADGGGVSEQNAGAGVGARSRCNYRKLRSSRRHCHDAADLNRFFPRDMANDAVMAWEGRISPYADLGKAPGRGRDRRRDCSDLAAVADDGCSAAGRPPHPVPRLRRRNYRLRTTAAAQHLPENVHSRSRRGLA